MTTIANPKDYLPLETERNEDHTDFYLMLVKRAFGSDLVSVTIAHHLVFSYVRDGKHVVREIPSADTALFDPEIMGAVFGGDSDAVRMRLAVTPIELRETACAAWLSDMDNQKADWSGAAYAREVENDRATEMEQLAKQHAAIKAQAVAANLDFAAAGRL